MCIALSKDLAEFLQRQFERADRGHISEDQLDAAWTAAENAQRAKQRGAAWSIPPEPIGETIPEPTPTPKPAPVEARELVTA